MAYADQQMSGNKVTALVVVAILHIVVGYALVTGLAYEAVQKIKERVTAVDIKEEKPPEEPPPPPPEEPVTPPPIVAPPPPIAINRTAPDVQVVDTPPPPAPAVVIPVPAPPPPAPPPPPRFTPKAATPKGNPGSWQRESDYPSAALREDRSGTTGVTVQVGADGRVAGCSVSKSSGSPDLDAAACKLITRSGRFNPATDGDGNPTTGTWRSSVRWEIPE